MKRNLILRLLLAIAIGLISTEAYSVNLRAGEPEEIPIKKDPPIINPRAPQRNADVTLSYDGSCLYICFKLSQGDAVVTVTTAEMEYAVTISTDEPTTLYVGAADENSTVTIETEQGNSYIGYF